MFSAINKNRDLRLTMSNVAGQSSNPFSSTGSSSSKKDQNILE